MFLHLFSLIYLGHLLSFDEAFQCERIFDVVQYYTCILHLQLLLTVQLWVTWDAILALS